MPHYRVLLNGRNFWLRFDGRPQRKGFYTTRFVEAPDPKQAENDAIEVLRAQAELKPLNDPKDPPLLFVDDIKEVDPADVPAVVRGFTFYPDDEASH